MFHALKFRPASQGRRHQAAICAASLTSFLLICAFAASTPAGAQGVTIEPIAKSQPASETHGAAEHLEGPEIGPEMGPEIADQPITIVNEKPDAPVAPEATVANDAEPISVEADPLMQAASQAYENEKAEDKGGAKPLEVTTPSNAASPEASGDIRHVSEPGSVEIEPADELAEEAKPEKAGKEVQVAAVEPAHKTDIFDQWALQKFEKHKEKPPHPLAAAHPDDFVVVCEAGCAERSPEIVYLERRNARGPVNEKPIKSGVVATSANSIDCVGGCYDGGSSYQAVAALKSQTSVAEVDEGEGWMTTVKKAQPEKRKTEVKKHWYDRLN